MIDPKQEREREDTAGQDDPTVEPETLGDLTAPPDEADALRGGGGHTAQRNVCEMGTA